MGGAKTRQETRCVLLQSQSGATGISDTQDTQVALGRGWQARQTGGHKEVSQVEIECAHVHTWLPSRTGGDIVNQSAAHMPLARA